MNTSPSSIPSGKPSPERHVLLFAADASLPVTHVFFLINGVLFTVTQVFRPADGVFPPEEPVYSLTDGVLFPVKHVFCPSSNAGRGIPQNPRFPATGGRQAPQGSQIANERR